MKRRVTVRPRAQADIDECALFIAADSPDAARRFLANAQRTVASMLLFPESGSPVVSRRKSLAKMHAKPVIGFRNYLVFYRVIRSRVCIVRVLHGARDIAAILQLAR